MKFPCDVIIHCEPNKKGTVITMTGWNELIRCKDCKHMVEHKGYGYLGESAYTCESNMGGWILPDSYCSRAERKEE